MAVARELLGIMRAIAWEVRSAAAYKFAYEGWRPKTAFITTVKVSSIAKRIQASEAPRD